jgi:hypothetical protein
VTHDELLKNLDKIVQVSFPGSLIHLTCKEALLRLRPGGGTVDTSDLKSEALEREGSNPSLGTNQ